MFAFCVYKLLYQTQRLPFHLKMETHGDHRRPLSDYPRDTVIVDESVAWTDENGFRPKKRKALRLAADRFGRLPEWRLASLTEFVIENPLMGLLWDSDALELLKSNNIQGHWMLARNVPTSYCNFGFEYQKPTNFFTTLVNVNLPAPCPGNPCDAVRSGLKHASGVAECSQSVANRVPEGIVHSLLDAWVEKLHQGGVLFSHLVVVDAFTGFGSVERACRSWSNCKLKVLTVVANDVVRSRDSTYNVDMSKEGALDLLTQLSLAAARNALEGEEEAAFDEGQVGVLIWLSTPCETYGPQGRGFHRPIGNLISEQATKHDAMNLTMARWLYKKMLTPPN